MRDVLVKVQVDLDVCLEGAQAKSIQQQRVALNHDCATSFREFPTLSPLARTESTPQSASVVQDPTEIN